MDNLTIKQQLIDYLIEQVKDTKELAEFTAKQPYNQFTDILIEDRKNEVRKLIEYIEFVGSK